jgi:hypothetical protein
MPEACLYLENARCNCRRPDIHGRILLPYLRKPVRGSYTELPGMVNTVSQLVLEYQFSVKVRLSDP